MTVSDPEVFVPSPRDGIAGRLVEEGATSSGRSLDPLSATRCFVFALC
jgi:hypothetical protein